MHPHIQRAPRVGGKDRRSTPWLNLRTSFVFWLRIMHLAREWNRRGRGTLQSTQSKTMNGVTSSFVYHSPHVENDWVSLRTMTHTQIQNNQTSCREEADLSRLNIRASANRKSLEIIHSLNSRKPIRELTVPYHIFVRIGTCGRQGEEDKGRLCANAERARTNRTEYEL